MRGRDYDPMRRWGCAGVIALYALAAAGFVWLAVTLSGCTSTRYVPVETVRTEYKEADTTSIYNRLRSYFEALRQKETSRDSVIDRTKETVVIKENGDTARHDRERIVYVSSLREKELEHKLSQRDSTIDALRLQLASVKADSIAVPYPVERELTWWQQTKMDFGGMALGAVVAALCVAVVWLLKKCTMHN